MSVSFGECPKCEMPCSFTLHADSVNGDTWAVNCAFCKEGEE